MRFLTIFVVIYWFLMIPCLFLDGFYFFFFFQFFAGLYWFMPTHTVSINSIFIVSTDFYCFLLVSTGAQQIIDNANGQQDY